MDGFLVLFSIEGKAHISVIGSYSLKGRKYVYSDFPNPIYLGRPLRKRVETEAIPSSNLLILLWETIKKNHIK
jgi:hypothetical protein